MSVTPAVRERIAALPATKVSRERRGPLRTDRLLAEHGPSTSSQWF